jgi:type I restriction enzyme M protein
MNPSSDLVNKLWRLCALLRKDGVTYQQYVTELTYLLFLKMASEQKDESRIPEQYRWGALKAASETEVLTRYRQALIDLGDGTKIADRSVVAIFQNAATIVREPANLRKLINAIDGLHWFSEERDAFGDAYEGLLQKMAEETKRGAGQYFTPRALIKVMVELMQPQPGEVIQDPAAGTGGFLIAANSYMNASDDYFELSPKQQAFQLQQALRGLENVPDTFRLLLMNLHLHAIDPDNLDLADTLSPAGARSQFKNADLILTNPPFGPRRRPAHARRPDDHRPRLILPASLRRALRPRAPPRRPRGGDRARQRAVRRRPRQAAAPAIDELVQPAHDPTPADRLVLRAGSQDQCAVLHPRHRGSPGHRRDRGRVDLRRPLRRPVLRQD